MTLLLQKKCLVNIPFYRNLEIFLFFRIFFLIYDFFSKKMPTFSENSSIKNKNVSKDKHGS